MGPHDPAPVAGRRLPLSSPQREVWIDQMVWPESAHLNIGGGAFLVGKFDRALFREALNRLVAETQALRLVPGIEDGQVLLDEFRPEIEVIDLRAEPQPREAMRRWWNQRIAVPFVLDGQPPWRFTLLLGGNELHGLTIQFHHLVMDGWGTSIVMRRWSDLYNALAENQSARPSEAPDYADFVAESNAYLGSTAFARDAGFWTEKLAALPERLLEPKNPTGELRSLAPARLATYHIARPAYERTLLAARTLGVTPFVLFLAAVAIYFSRIRNREEIVIGVPSLNRGKRYRNTPGMFAGVLPVGVTIRRDATPEQLLGEINLTLRGALRHASYPLSEIGRNVEVIRQGRDSIFDVLLSYERQDFAMRFGDAQLTDSRQLFSGISRYPFGMTVCEFNGGQDIELALEGSAGYFSDGDMDLLGHRLWHIVEAIGDRSDARLGEIDVLAPEELWAVVDGFHKDIAHHDCPQTFISQFEHQSALRPEATALTWDYGRMDYQTLDRRAGALAARLLSTGVGRNAVVAVAIPRSPEMMLALLAVAKAGAAFLPLDVDVPMERAKDILAQAGAVALLIQDDWADRFGTLGTPCIVVDAATPIEEGGPRRPAGASAEDLAYVLFTSGSTGSPKGVAVDHASLSRRLAWLSNAYAVEWHDRSAQATQISFDPALIEALLPLINGASVALPPPGRLRPESLAGFAVAHGVTIMAFVPSTLSSFLDGVRDRRGLRLRVACCGGEVLRPELAERYLAETGARLFNVYGPTEATIFATAWECHAGNAMTELPVGRPIDDTRIYVLDAALRPLPFGEEGEIFIGGETLARGYLNQPSLSAESFLPDPFLPGRRMYRTGDRGRIGNDENLYFSGRRDRQVKLRGYRIELGEIETTLAALEGVERTAAKLVEHDGKPQIFAWVASPREITPESVHQHLRRRLPDYMQPARVETRPSLPLTASGKIDYDRLRIAGAGSATPQPSRPPSTDLERQLLRLWEEVLGKHPMGVQDNFFAAGGDSLAAITILSGIEKLTGQKASLYALTEHPTVERLAEALQSDACSARLMVRLSRSRSPGLPLYVAASGHGDLLRLNNLAAALGDGFDVHMLQPASGTSVRRLMDLATLYADRIAMKHSAAPCIAGFSVGGLTALETARILENRGIPVRQLVLIDTVYPSKVIGGRRFWDALGWLARNLHVQDLSMNGRRLEAMFNDPGLRLQVSALDGYTPGHFGGNALLVRSTGLTGWDRWLFRPWRKLFADRLAEEMIQGLHGSMFEASSVDQLAEVLKAHLPTPANGAPSNGAAP